MKTFLALLLLTASLHAGVPRRGYPLPVAQADLPLVQLRLDDAPLPEEPAPSTEAIRQTIQHLQRIAQESATGLKEAEAENARLVTALNAATAALQAGQGEIDGVRGELEQMRAWGVEQQRRADRAEAGERKQTGLAWKWRLLAIGTWMLVIAFFVARQYFPFLKFF